MELNEIFLLIVVIAILLTTQFFLKWIKQPLNSIIKVFSGLFLLVLIWFFIDEGNILLKILMTILIVISAIKPILDYINYQRQMQTKAK